MSHSRYALSLDIGANSIGWACLACDEEGEPCALLNGISLGAHVFDAGVENFFGSGQGKEESRGAKRRAARMMRRQLRRRARRQARTYNLLAAAGLLPALSVNKPRTSDGTARREYQSALALARDAAIKALDMQLAAKFDTPQAIEHLPYFLRARALDYRLEPHELGRALYHLAQRRGFKSARKGGSKEADEERSTVLKAIKDLRAELEPEGKDGKARTLGEFFARKLAKGEPVRRNWTGRRMYQDEFAALWKAQSAHLPAILTEDLRVALAGRNGDGGAMFHQRPLRIQDHLIGVCDIYDGVKRRPEQKRAPWYCLEAQRFRMLQKVNDLRILDANGDARELTPEQRKTLVDALELNAKVSLKRPRKNDDPRLNLPDLLGLNKKEKVNFMGGDEDTAPDLPGNRTAASLAAIFGENKWRELTPQQQSEIADTCWDTEDDETLREIAISRWGLSAEQAMQFVDEFSLEEDYCGLSRKALREILPAMEQGKPYMTARLEVFGEDPRPPVLDLLPPVKDYLRTLRNPVVFRALTELRRVVNAIVRRHGKPFVVRIELAREMKKSSKDREKILKQNRQREAERRKAAARIVSDCTGLYKNADDVKPWDIEKVLLWQECGGTCPYTGREIPFCDLFGQAIDVEHIIPYARSLDNSFQNKTLCYADENRNVKKRQTPYEAYGHTDKWVPMLDRVARFRNPDKLTRFGLFGPALEKYLSEFTNAQLVNTAYAARLALDYLATLYGLPGGKSHIADESGRQRIQVCNGRLTSLFRAAWRLNDILGEDGKKKRTDHRHHAVDALCIGCTTVRNRQKLERQIAEFERRRPPGSNKQFSLKHGDVPPPWGALAEFHGQVEARIRSCNVSHRVDKKVSGALHDESLYSPRFNAKGLPDPDGEYSHIRKPVHMLSADAINSDDEVDRKGRFSPANIVDPVVRKAVQEKLKAVGGDPKKLEQDLPRMPRKDGQPGPFIRSVRIRKKNKTMRIGSGITERHVESGSNHHVEIVQVADKKGRPKWEMRFVTMLEAYQRLKRKQPVVNRQVGTDEEFICSLVGGDAFLWEAEEGKPEVFRVRTLDAGNERIAFVRNADSRKKKEIQESGDFIEKSGEMLRKGRFQKVTVTPLGEVRPVRD